MDLSTLIREAERRGLLGTADDGWDDLVARVKEEIRESLVPQQLAFFSDPSTWSAAYCSRQCGKGFTVARLMLDVALSRPNAVCVYVAQTYGEARKIMWDEPLDGLPAVCRQLGVPARTNESRLELSFPNGSVVRVTGADRGFWQKLRGQKIDCLVADECQKAEDVGFQRAVEQVVPDCLAARHGIFRAIGTPDEFCVGYFHDICTQGRPGWTVHHWTAEDLQHVTSVWSEQLRWKAEHNIADDDPVWLREKRGLWVRQDSALLLPVGPMGLWDGRYPDTVPSRSGVLVPRTLGFEHYGGIDWGFTDAFAVVVASVSREEGRIREVHSEKHRGINTHQMADIIRAAKERYDVRLFYADASRPDTIKDMRELHHLDVTAAEKHDKEPWITEMRACLVDGRLQVLRDSVLHQELGVLVPDPDQLLKKKLTALPGSEDHAYDALRYTFRGIRTNHVKQPEPPLTTVEREQLRLQRERDERFGLVKPKRTESRGVRWR